MDRQACAIESAASKNSDRDIFVIFTSSVGAVASQPLPLYIDSLLMYPNVYMRNMNLSRYLTKTPIFKWFKSNKLFESVFLSEHLSDILPIATLHRYGGLYLESDVIVQRTLDGLEEDFLGDTWLDSVSNGVMHLNTYGIGKEVTQRFFRWNMTFV